MPNRTEARPAKAEHTNATGRLPVLRLFSTPLIDLAAEIPPRKTSSAKGAIMIGISRREIEPLSRGRAKGLSRGRFARSYSCRDDASQLASRVTRFRNVQL